MGFDDWKKVRLGEVIELNPKISLKKGLITKKVAMEHIKEFTRKIQGYDLVKYKSGSKFQNGDTLFARITPCLENGKTAFVDILDKNEVAFGSTEFFVLRAKRDVMDPKFLYYLSITENFRSIAIQSMTGTSGRQRAQKEALLEYELILPPLVHQQKISKVLSNFDEKIEVNNEIVSTLEQLAQILFKRWFVDFEFPNENGVAYKSSGGEMVESELGMIPKGWEISDIKSIAKQNGVAVKIEELQEVVPYIGLEHMPRGSIALSDWESSEKVTSNKTQFKKYDILFGKLRPYFKKVGIAPINGICSTDILVLHTKEDTYYYYFSCLISQDIFIEYCTATATGTRMPRTGWKQISSYKLVLPPNEILEKFNDLINPLYEKINSLIHEGRALKELRDTLLPKLLSGEIELPDETEVTEHVPV